MLQTGVVATYVQELISRRKRSKLGGASLLSSYGTPQGKKGSLLLTYLLTYLLWDTPWNESAKTFGALSVLVVRHVSEKNWSPKTRWLA